MYCNGSALTEPAGICPAGHFCDEGTAGPFSNPCPPAFYLAFEGAESDSACARCTSGSFCPLPGTETPTECPAGKFCGTGVDSPADCPLGTFSNSTGLKRSGDCLPCPPGKFCDGFGLTEPAGDCEPGFFCRSRSQTSAPTDGITGGLCPAGTPSC